LLSAYLGAQISNLQHLDEDAPGLNGRQEVPPG
jgi:hypothetical protein